MKWLSRQWTKRTVFALAMVALLALLCGCASAQMSSSQSVIASLSADDTPAVPQESASSSLAVNPIDFKALQAENDDVYAWLYVPDTAVNIPVLQNKVYDNFYLTHDMYGNDSVVGAAYSQSMNKLDFSDSVTVIYGHTFEVWQEDLKDEMFGTLHNYEDASFFDSHDKFYIYTPDKILTYQVVSAYEYDNRHIMNSFDFSDSAVLQTFFDSVMNPDSMVKNVNEDVKLKAGESKVVILSTCTRPANDSARYLLAGVLVDEQPTG